MIRTATTLVLLLAVLSVPALAQTNPPIIGTYKTLAGSILPGRATLSSQNAGELNLPGQVIDAESYNGSVLAGQWKVSCAQSGASTLLFDGVTSGTGQRIYQTPFTGGTLWLAGGGPWGTGDAQYTGSFSNFSVTTVQQIVGGQIVGIVANVSFTGMLDNYASCFTMAIANAELVGFAPNAPAEPGPFPAFLSPYDCNQTVTFGSYWDVHDITFSILGQCAVSAQQPTWGKLKNMYR
jgi:hypothetical protein